MHALLNSGCQRGCLDGCWDEQRVARARLLEDAEGRADGLDDLPAAAAGAAGGPCRSRRTPAGSRRSPCCMGRTLSTQTFAKGSPSSPHSLPATGKLMRDANLHE